MRIFCSPYPFTVRCYAPAVTLASLLVWRVWG